MDWRKLDIRHRDDVVALARRARHTAVINAAYRQSDWETIANGGMHVALAAATAGARLVHALARLTTRLRGAREFLAPTPT